MNKKLIISANGPDRKGIVSEISSIINTYNGNIETSRMIRLKNEFAFLILIDIKNKNIKSLNAELKKIKNLQIKTIQTENNHEKQYDDKFHLYINGADNEGIVYKFSHHLSKADMSIDEVNTKIKNAPVSGTPLFMMDLIIGSSQSFNHKKLTEELNVIAEKLGVEISIKKINLDL